MNSIRKPIQYIFLLLALGLLLRHLLGLTNATVESYCPGGALEILPYYLMHQVFLCATNAYNMSIFVALVLGTIIAGRAFCSWVCPIGTLMEFLETQGRQMKTFAFGVWNGRFAVLGWGRYLVLVAVLVLTYQAQDLVFRPFCPYYVIMGGDEHEVAWWSKWLMLGLAGAALYLPFFWCRVLCPLGAALGLIRRASPLAPVIDTNRCTSCEACDRACPQQIKIHEEIRVVSSDCTQCLACTEACPENCLHLGLGYSAPEKGSHSALRIMYRGVVPLVAILVMAGGFFHAYRNPFPSYTKTWNLTQAVTAPSQVEMIIKGLKCRGSCGVLARHLASETGILSFKAYTNEHRAVIEFDGALTSREKIQSRVEKSPFSVTKVLQ